MNNTPRIARSVDQHIPKIAIIGALASLSAVSVSAQQTNRADLRPPTPAQLPQKPSLEAVSPTLDVMAAALRPDRFKPQLVSSKPTKTAVIVRPDQVPRAQAVAGQAALLADPFAGRLRPDQAMVIERVQAAPGPPARSQVSQVR